MKENKKHLLRHGGVTRDENSCVYSGGSHPRNTNRWTQITAQ